MGPGHGACCPLEPLVHCSLTTLSSATFAFAVPSGNDFLRLDPHLVYVRLNVTFQESSFMQLYLKQPRSPPNHLFYPLSFRVLITY